MEEDEVFLKDGTVTHVIDIVTVALKHNQQPLVIEGGFFLATLTTAVTTRQLAGYLFRTDLVVVFLQLLESKCAPFKLLLFTLEALGCLFDCDKQHFVAEPGNQSLLAFFEAQDGFEVLSRLAGANPSFEVYSATMALLERHGPRADDDMEHLFESDSKRIYDDSQFQI